MHIGASFFLNYTTKPQKLQSLCIRIAFFIGVEGALHFMYTICYFFMQLFLQDFAVGS
jgi:hypothetical protein